MEDPQKIRAKLDELNKINPAEKWAVADGYHTFTSVDYHPKGNSIFYPDKGVPIKVFINRTTGELRTYLAQVFEAEKQENEHN